METAYRPHRAWAYSRQVTPSLWTGTRADETNLGFNDHIFPQDSRPFLSLVANIGLCLFLFLIGLEIDSSVIKRNARLSITVAFAGVFILSAPTRIRKLT